MIKRAGVVFIIALLMLTGTSAFALDLQSSGLTVISQEEEGDRIAYEVEDGEGRSFTVVGDDDFSRAQLTIITELAGGFFSWQKMSISYLRIIVTGNRAEVLAVPASFEHDEVDLVQYMPSGMQFFYDGFLEYDFRLKVGTIFVRMRGQFFDEEQFSNRLVSAARDPALFVALNDPEYLIRRVQEAEEAIDTLLGRGVLVAESLQQTQREFADFKTEQLASYQTFYQEYQALKNAYNNTQAEFETLEADYQALKREGGSLKNDYLTIKADYLETKADYLEVKADQIKLREEHETLLAKHDDLDKRHADLVENHEKLDGSVVVLTGELKALRAGLLAEHNWALFVGAREVDEELIEQVLRILESDPELSSNEVVSRLQESGTQAEPPLVKLIIQAYLGKVR